MNGPSTLNALLWNPDNETTWLRHTDNAANRLALTLARNGRPTAAAELLAAHVEKTEVIRARVVGPPLSPYDAGHVFNECAVRQERPHMHAVRALVRARGAA